MSCSSQKGLYSLTINHVLFYFSFLGGDDEFAWNQQQLTDSQWISQTNITSLTVHVGEAQFPF